MFKYLIGVLILIIAVLLWMSFWVGVPTVVSVAVPESPTPHLVHDEARSIEKIGIAAFYFVPKNKIDSAALKWKALLDQNLEKLKKFHALQFRELSDIHYILYPEPVIGEEDSIFYDTESTAHGNPYALINVAEELERRVFAKGGDLYRESFVRELNDTYPVMAIVYEGVGAAGGVINESEHESLQEIAEELGLPPSTLFEVTVDSSDGFFLVNRRFLEGEYGPFGESIFAHEFYHTLGIADKYEDEHALPSSQDIMGLGRFRPIEKTYLERDTLKQLGL